MCASALIGLGSAVVGGLASGGAAAQQAKAAKKQFKLQKKQWKRTVKDLEPYRDSGEQNLEAWNYMNGFGDRPSGYSGFEGSAAFHDNMELGRDTIEAGASGGTLYSGRTGSALEKFRHRLASTEINTHLNRLQFGATMGQNAAVQTGVAGQNFANQGGQALGAFGDAGAAGAIGIGNAITGGIETGLSAYKYFNDLNQPQNPGTSVVPEARPW